MPTSTPLTVTRQNNNDALYGALFVCELQQSENPTTNMVAQAITRTIHRLGTAGCAGQMAQEFGDHPDAARDRMRWVGSVNSRPGPACQTARNRSPASTWRVRRRAVRPRAAGLPAALNQI